MAEVLLFHHVCGLTEGVLAIADDLRAMGHRVHTPDLFDGRSFPDIEAGAEYAAEVGFGELIDLGVAAAGGLPAELVYAGISLGALPAQRLAQTRAGARGAVLMEACVAPETFGTTWPALPLQIHGMGDDPYFAGEGDIDAAREIVRGASDGIAELVVYTGDTHLFADRSLASYDTAAAAELLTRMSQFLARIDAGDPVG